MLDLKITSRADFYSGEGWKNYVNSRIVEKKGYTIVRGANIQELDDIVFEMNYNHDHPEGEFYSASANSNDHDYVDYYVIYRNPRAP